MRPLLPIFQEQFNKLRMGYGSKNFRQLEF